jgi:hypothetical protein
MGRQGRRHEQLLDDRQILIDKALDRTLWITCLGRTNGCIVKQTME